jgi:hypothetical protein
MKKEASLVKVKKFFASKKTQKVFNAVEDANGKKAGVHIMKFVKENQELVDEFIENMSEIKLLLESLGVILKLSIMSVLVSAKTEEIKKNGKKKVKKGI